MGPARFHCATLLLKSQDQYFRRIQCVFQPNLHFEREENHDRIVAIILELEFGRASTQLGSTEALLPSPPPTPPSAPPLEAPSSSSLSTDHESFDEWRRKIQQELGQVTMITIFMNYATNYSNRPKRSRIVSAISMRRVESSHNQCNMTFITLQRAISLWLDGVSFRDGTWPYD